MATLLNSFLTPPASLYFLPGSNDAQAFTDIQKVCTSGGKPKKGKRKFGNANKTRKSNNASKALYGWTQSFLADKLAMLLVLRSLREKEKADIPRQLAQRGATPMNDLKRAFSKLYDTFKPCYKLYLEDQRN